MAKNLLGRIGAGVAGLVMLATVGCTTVSPSFRNENISLHNGYTASSHSAEADLRTISGIALGTVKVRKTERGYQSEGSFSQTRYPSVFDKACSIADTNGDKNITDYEAETLLIKAYEVATK